MKATYEEAMVRVLADEGGYTNDAGDPGGPTNWGITIADARHYWKHNATVSDVRSMPKSVAESIYAAHYAAPIDYDQLPPGVDYAVFDYGINSGTWRGVHTLQSFVGAHADGLMGADTLKAVLAFPNPDKLIADIYDSRLHYLQGLRTWHIFGHGWGIRVRTGKTAAIGLWNKYKSDWNAQRVTA